MGEIKYNGRTYSGLIQANGCFIDTDNVIVDTTISANVETTYTATEDCVFDFLLYSSGGQNSFLRIDGKNIISSNTPTNRDFVFLRKGQVATFESYGTNGKYTVYGLLQGSPITFLSEYASACYDTNEREVGCWIDGKPIYQRTVHIGNLTFDSSWHNVAHGIADIDKVISCIGIMFGEDGEFFSLPIYRSATQQGITWGIQGSSSEYLAYINNWYNSTNDSYATILYTKTTDTAGSGKLTPTGFETHHYSTNEQIVGTWIDGKPIYERTWDFSGSPVMLSYANWVNSGISASENIESIISAELKYGAVILANVEVGVNVDGYPVGFQKLDNLNTRGVSYCTLKYTKTTD